MADEQYVKITTPLTIKGAGSTLWDMGFQTRRIIAAADFIIEDIHLQGFTKDVTPTVFFFIFHNDAEVICKNCFVEDACAGGYATAVFTQLLSVRLSPGSVRATCATLPLLIVFCRYCSSLM